jgi:hypothetical protein
MRLLGGYGLIGLAAVAAQQVLSVAGPTARVSTSTGGSGGDAGTAGTEDSADGPSIETAPETDGGGGEIDGTVEYVVEPLADYAVSLVEPGIVFFLGAALVFTIGWAYWYWGGR